MLRRYQTMNDLMFDDFNWPWTEKGVGAVELLIQVNHVLKSNCRVFTLSRVSSQYLFILVFMSWHWARHCLHPTSPLGAYINEQNMLPRKTLHFLWKFCSKGLLRCGEHKGVRDLHAVSLLWSSLSLWQHRSRPRHSDATSRRDA
jgi:hypothetical protein